MKKRKTYLLIIKISAFVLLAGLLGLYFAFTKENLAVLIVSAIVGAIGLISLITFGVLSVKPDDRIKELWTSYLRTAQKKAQDRDNALQGFDYKNELEKTRAKYAADGDPKKNRIEKPNFSGAGDLCDFSVLNGGRVYYACLVEANEGLFRMPKNVYEVMPAVFLYGTDEYFDEHPEELIPLAERVFQDKQHNFLKNEKSYFSNLRLPLEMTDGKTVYATVILAYRRHLPLGKLGGCDLVPVIADPDRSPSVFIADSKYWSEELICKYINNL